MISLMMMSEQMFKVDKIENVGDAVSDDSLKDIVRLDVNVNIAEDDVEDVVL